MSILSNSRFYKINILQNRHNIYTTQEKLIIREIPLVSSNNSFYVLDFQTVCDAFYNNSCFIHVKSPYREWTDANTDCVSSGGYLTSINSVIENDMLASIVANAPGSGLGSNAWIGLDYNSYTGSTNWVDGTPVTYSKEPDTIATNPLCFVITGSGTWRAFPCNDERQYICKKPGGMFKLY